MMHGHEKSDSVIVAEKPANKAKRSAAEPVERAGSRRPAEQTVRFQVYFFMFMTRSL
jgi:hypothetical protein